MEVVHRQDPLETTRDPTRLRERLALGAVPVAARVVRGSLETASRAHVQVTAEHGGPALLDRAQRRALLRTQPPALGEGLAVSTNDVRELERGACARGRTRRSHGRSAERVEWALDRLHGR